MESEGLVSYIDKNFDSWFVKGLGDFVRVPNLTQMADPEFKTNGLIYKAIEIVDQYIKKLEIKGLKSHVFHPEG